LLEGKQKKQLLVTGEEVHFCIIAN